jgi:hypothetical protein
MKEHAAVDIQGSDRPCSVTTQRNVYRTLLILNPVPCLLESRVKPCSRSHKACGPTRTNRIKTDYKAVRMEVKLFLEQSLIIVVKQLSRQSVRIGIKRLGGSNNRECSVMDQCDRDLFTANPYLREQIAPTVNDLESCVPTSNGRWYDYIGNDMHRRSTNQRVHSCGV